MTRYLLLITPFILLAMASCNSSKKSPEIPSNTDMNVSVISKLAADQLEAYNNADLDAFCACYHPEVRVFDGDTEKPPGIEAFRKRYVKMFAAGGFGATVSERIAYGKHCVDLEHWWREDGKRGTVIVRYTERDGLIGIVQFLK